MRPHSRLTAHQSKKFVERRQMRGLLVLSLVFISIVSWVFALSRLSMLDALTIRTIEVKGIDQSVAANLQAAALNAIQGDYLGIFSRSNALIYPHDAVADAVQASSPRIAAVKVSRNGVRGLSVTVSERDPAAVICANLPEFAADGLASGDPSPCYFADAEGYIYMAVAAASLDGHHRYYVPALGDSSSSTTDAVIGAHAASAGSFAALQGFYDRALESGIPVLSILIKDGGEYEMYAGTSGSDTAVIYFNDARPLAEELDNLIAFWKRMASEAQAGGKGMSFEYIDVRYGSNVFYRKIQ